jgi:hypothetical protein
MEPHDYAKAHSVLSDQRTEQTAVQGNQCFGSLSILYWTTLPERGAAARVLRSKNGVRGVLFRAALWRH